MGVSPLAYLIFDRQRVSRADRPLLQAVVVLPLFLGLLIGGLQVLPTPSRDDATVPSRPAGDARAPTNEEPRTAAKAVTERLSTLGSLESDFTTNTRLQDARWAVNDWLASPVLGRGTGSFGQIHGMRVGTEAWISNVILHTLVDTGLVGLAIQMSLFVLVARRAWRAALVAGSPVLEIGLKGLTLGFLVLAIAYQVTDGTWMAIFWVHLGLMVSGIYYVQDEQRRLATAPAPAGPQADAWQAAAAGGRG
jgi:hypothetical protein